MAFTRRPGLRTSTPQTTQSGRVWQPEIVVTIVIVIVVVIVVVVVIVIVVVFVPWSLT